ncbi:MAG: TonB-dependent receptor [Nitrosomonas sp.]|nr:TonB-dependent receptor [Nitrosomonas sp.]MDL1863612.1 TonB-dependent receptor [Betaproteobacteria bacterium PRO5]
MKQYSGTQPGSRLFFIPWRTACSGSMFMLVFFVASQICYAQSATPGATLLKPIVITAPREEDSFSSRTKLESLPGGTSYVAAEEMPGAANLTASKAFFGTPGLIVQDFFGGNDQPRIQIRGSGLQQNPVERGILVLQNGLPINRADGSYIVGFINPRQAEAIEVYRGYMANRLSANVLGGALNFISPSGITASNTRMMISGGSFGQVNLSGQAGAASGDFDGLIQADFNRRDGYRDYNDSRRFSVSGNAGWHLSEDVTTRLFASYTDLGFDVAGPLSKDQLKSSPRSVSAGPVVTPAGAIYPGPNVIRDQPERTASQFLVGSRTTLQFDKHILDFALGFTHTDDTFRFPVSSGIRETRGSDLTGVIRYTIESADKSALPIFESAAYYTAGWADRKNYLNRSGTQGEHFGASKLDATTLSLHANLNIPIHRNLTLTPAISYSRATRDNKDTYDSPTRPTLAYRPNDPTQLLPAGAVPYDSTRYKRSFDSWNPSLALTFRPVAGQTLFTAISRSFEPPTHDDLLATVNGTPNSSAGRPNPANPALPAAVFVTPDLKAQTAMTLEGGWRGSRGILTWDAVAYYAWIDNELLSLRDESGVSLGSVNADKTTHLGIEFGLKAQLTEHLLARIAYTYQDFRFDNDPVRNNNRLAGAPPHFIQTQLQARIIGNLVMQAAVKWVPVRIPVDNMNTLYVDPYAVLDLRAEYRFNRNFTVFGETTNLFNKTYASSSLVVDQARSDQAVFLPGDGRAFFAGIRATF